MLMISLGTYFFHHLNKLSYLLYITGGMFKSNGTTSLPKSVPRLVLDKVRLLFPSEMFCSSQTLKFPIKVFH